jgi:hypothetical protein
MPDAATEMSAAERKPARIEIEGDVLVPDEEFRSEYLNGATRRTANRYDSQGLPFVIVNGRKMRPVSAGKAWLASRIRRRNPLRIKARR